MDKDKGLPAVKIGSLGPTGEPCEEVFPGPCSFVIFGASGDLSQRKLLPSLFKLFRKKVLSKNFFIIGASRTELDDASFRAMTGEAVRNSGEFERGAWAEFSARLYYLKIDYGDREAYSRIKRLLVDREKAHGTKGNRIFYFATPPFLYTKMIEGLGGASLSSDAEGKARVVIEKPYGRDLKSAIELEQAVLRHFREEQVYRIDHYLGKETVQNIIMLRFANSIFEPIWNRRYIDHVQITVAEDIGVEKRAGYYEQAGVLRDMFQNHMLQVLSFIAMEPPSVYESELVRDERVKVFKALRPPDLNNIEDYLVLGQYVEGEAEGRLVTGYTEEEGIARDSTVPTYAAMKVYIDNWRWQGVPFYLRSGKRLKKRFSQVTIQFKDVPHLMFREALGDAEIGPNALVLMIQPDERVQLKFHTKNPGSKVCLRDVLMDFSYAEGYVGIELDDYERVLMDCMIGDKMLFVRRDGVELTWSFLTPMLDMYEGRGLPELNLYRAGTFGPAKADKFIARDNRRWVNNE